MTSRAGPPARRSTVVALVLLVGAGIAVAAGATPGTGAAAAGSTSACTGTGKRPVAVGYRAATGADAGPIQLGDATDAWGADTPLTGMMAHAMATADVNRDGWTDVFVGTFADRPAAEYRERGADGAAPDRLLLGGPNGFTLDRDFPGELARTSGAAFGDLDGDGDPDLVIARNVRTTTEPGKTPTAILRNDSGRFTEVGTLTKPVGARSIGLLDYDDDGHLDLFVAEDRFTNGSSVLFHGNGDLTFDDVTAKAGIGRDVVGMGVGTGDLDGDGRPDLMVGGSNRLFLNHGGGTFRESSAAPGAWQTFGDEDDPAGVAEGDVNGDGRLDVVIGQHYNSTLDRGQRVPVRLYLNEAADDGALVLRDVTDTAGLIGLTTKSPHVEIADIDADGRPDIVTTASGADDRPIVFRNTGNGDGAVPTFTPTAKTGSTQYWVTGAVADFDHDGKLDIVSAEWVPSLPTRFWRNTGEVGHWLTVDAPVGSTVTVRSPSDGREESAEVGVSTGYSAGPSSQVQFGLGSTDAVAVSIARSGTRPVELPRVPVDRALVCRG